MAPPDIRFAVIEDAAALLDMLPRPELIVWPSDPGDQEAVDAALRHIGELLPKLKASRRAHRRMLRERKAAALRIVAAGVPGAMGNGARQ